MVRTPRGPKGVHNREVPLWSGHFSGPKGVHNREVPLYIHIIGSGLTYIDTEHTTQPLSVNNATPTQWSSVLLLICR